MLRQQYMSIVTRALPGLQSSRPRGAPLSPLRLLHHDQAVRTLFCRGLLLQDSASRTAGQESVSNDISAPMSSSPPPSISDQRETVVARLKTQCNALYEDNEAFVAPAHALSRWFQAVAALQSQSKSLEVDQEVERAYESAVAIASKQRQVELASQLTQQMQQLGYRPTERTHEMLVRNVALKLRRGPHETSVGDLRELLKDVRDDMWEREIMSIVEREARPLQLKTEREFALFHERLIRGVEAQLNEYERTAERDGDQKTGGKGQVLSSGPYNEALRVYADNGVKFNRMLQLMVARSIAVDIETYGALLLGARWNEIPATLSQLLQSKLVEELTVSTSASASEYVRVLWVNAMKAIVYSSTERFNSLSASVYKRDIDHLRKVFMFVDKQLSNAFAAVQFVTTMQYDEVYTMRAKAAAACGLIAPVKRILDEYVQHAPFGEDGKKRVLSKEPFLMALEIFPWSLMEVLMLSRQDALARAESHDVSTSPRVLEMRHMYERVMHKLDTARKTIDKIEQQINANDAKLSDDELRRLLGWQNLANETVGRESQRATTLERRLDNARVLKANQLLIKEHLERADRTVAFVLDKLLEAGFNAETDLDVSIKLMEQFMNSARRLDKRLAQRQKHVSPHMMRRVFSQVNLVSSAVRSGGLDVQDAETREKLVKFFEYAVCTAVRFWCEEETEALVRQQQRLLGTSQLAPREYDQLIFQSVTNLDVRRAHSLLQEMHNAGMKPSSEAIHRIALGLLHRRNVSSTDEFDMSGTEEDGEDDTGMQDEANENCADEADAVIQENVDEEICGEDIAATTETVLHSELSDLLNVSDRDAIENELEPREGLKLDGDDADNLSAESAATARTLLLGSDAPVTIEDLVGFLQDWYNLYGVKPFGKTVVPVMAQLLDASKFSEFRRLLQILESMDGGFTPATELWLEKRLSQLGGKTLDDFRLKNK
uniref:Uncharacterized protein n=1 Tax=Peronospora matthiolae TaxID=2874970 RepID=A0AAV1TV43_9STRA